MKILRNFLIGAGVLFLLIIILVMFLLGSSSQYLNTHEPFVKQFTHDFSQRWDVADVRQRCTEEFLAQIHTPNGRQAIHSFRQLGSLQDTSDFAIYSFTTNATSPTTGVIEFKARFENAEAVVIVTLHDESGITKVHAFRVTSVSNLHKHRSIPI